MKIMLDLFAATVALIVPLYLGYGIFYYKLGRVEQKLDDINGYNKKNKRR